ncbi:hypothetical protein TNIN_312731 [Trichonephila inaurata madagascariensis]|uniref:Uncharacterized protein n=1 Tax=Trichonephila inaurata madagascariensis TaxID=2747483 RepID=A0A8X6YP99_9ARAC|nr:hypothetical protein TNIN_312731 [Trichonephila inaurata madagascariensis]
MGYTCHRCNLEFPDFEQYLDHECKSYKKLPTQLTKNESWTLENLFHICKTANKSHIGNISVNKEKNTFWRTDTSLEFKSLDFDSNDYSANELRYQTFIERTTSQPVFDDFESYLQNQYAAYEPKAEVNFNQPSTSFGHRQISEMNAQINTNPLSASSPNQLFNWAMNQLRNINQETISAEYSQTHYQIRENNPEFNGYQPSVPSEYSSPEFISYGMNQHLDTNPQNVSSLHNKIEFYPPVENQNFHYPFRTSEQNKMELTNHEIYSLFNTNKPTVKPEYSQIEYCNKELNPQFDTSQITVSSEYNQVEFGRHEMIPLFDSNQLTLSSEYSHMEYCTNDMNPQINENQRTVTNKNHPFLGRIFSQRLTRISEGDLKPAQNFKSNEQKLDSVDSCINGEMKSANPKPLHQIDANISSINQNVLQSETFQTNTFLLNSSFKKHFNVDSKETQKESANFRRSVSIKGNQVGCNSYHKNTFEYCLGEKQFRETLDSSPCNDIRKESNTYDSSFRQSIQQEWGQDFDLVL